MKLTVKHNGFDKKNLELYVNIDNENNSIELEFKNSINKQNDIDCSKNNSDESKFKKDEQYQINEKLFNFIVSHCTAGAVFLIAVMYLKKEYFTKIQKMEFSYENLSVIFGYYIMVLMLTGSIIIYSYLVYNLHVNDFAKDKKFQKSKLFLIYGLSFWGIILAPIFYGFYSISN